MSSDYTIYQLLEEAGPLQDYFNPDGPPDRRESLEEIMRRLDRFAAKLPLLESPAGREEVTQRWVNYLEPHPDITNPWRVVKAAIKGNGTASGTVERNLRWLTDGEIETRNPPPSLIGNIIAEGSFAVIYGPSGVGKTFLALDMAMSVASGLEWQGLEVKKGRVAYILGEGLGGFGQRVYAWKASHAQDNADIKFLVESVNFLEPMDSDQLVNDLNSWEIKPALVFIDTLAQSIPGGEENSSSDMGKFIKTVNQIRQTTGATVGAIHHTGRAGNWERGHTSLRGAADTMLHVTAEDDILTVACYKQRDGAPFKNMRLQLAPFEGSCVITEPPDLTDHVTTSTLQTLRALSDVELTEGVASTAWEEASEQGSSTYQRARKVLVQGGYVELKERKYFITSKGTETLGKVYSHGSKKELP